MAGIDNPSFETVGAVVGEADGWFFVTTSISAQIADFSGAAGAAPRLSIESFGTTWFSGTWLTAVVNGTKSVFDLGIAQTPLFVESFLYWSQNKQWSATISNATASQFGSGTVESFDDGGWLPTITPAATFSESFAPVGWSATITGTPASFNLGASTRESFAPHQADVVFILKAGTLNTFTAIDPQTYQPQSHFLTSNFAAVVNTTGVRPGGVSQGLTYYVRFPSGAEFQLATSSGGSPISVTDAGAGLHSLHANENLFWTH